MFRRVTLALLFIAAAAAARPAPADAAPVSPRNPYRSFNISGVNYGSQQWERTRRGRSQASYRTHGLLFRRR